MHVAFSYATYFACVWINYAASTKCVADILLLLKQSLCLKNYGDLISLINALTDIFMSCKRISWHAWLASFCITISMNM
jgi:hypothetical protein